MLQAPFGPVGPGWMTMSSPGFPGLPTQLGPVGSPQLGSIGAPLGSMPSIGFGITPTVEAGAFSVSPFVGQAHAGGTLHGQSPLGWGMSPAAHTPLSAPFSIPEGITAPGLLAGIALRRGQPQGPTSDQDVEEFIYDALELLPGAGDVEVRCESGRATLTGSVPHKRLKRDVGEIAWAIPGINDVQNNIGITTRRRSRAFTREPEAQQTGSAGRKQS